MEATGKTAGNNPVIKSDTIILHEFQNNVCRNEAKPCPYWNSGCSFKNACRKFSDYKYRIRAKEKLEKETLIQAEKLIPRNKLISKDLVREKVTPIIQLLQQLESLDYIRNKAYHFDIMEAKKSLLELTRQ